MFTAQLFRTKFGSYSKKSRIVIASTLMLIVTSATFAHAFISFNSSLIRFSTNESRSNSSSLAGKTVSGNIFVFSNRTDITRIQYYLNPQGSLDYKSLIGDRTQAPYDMAGSNKGVPVAFDTSSAKLGSNLLVSKITFKKGNVHHDFTWFNIKSVDKPTTTTSSTTTTTSTTSTTTTTTTVPSGHGGHGSGGDENCIPGRQGMHGPCVDDSTIPAPEVGRGFIPFHIWGIPQPGTGEPGSFRTRCEFSHMNNDDSILYPNQPGRAHLHAYFGNTQSNAFTTPNSILTQGNSTCHGGILNRSSYWVPAMVDSRDGRVIRPNDDRSIYHGDLEIYYKLGYQGVTHTQVRSFPNGLTMIAGNAANATTETPNSKVYYHCEPATNQNAYRNGPTIPNCPRGDIVVMRINFPQCWDGRNLTSTNGRSHMAYGTWGVGCPSSHPVGLPNLEMIVRYRVNTPDSSTWRLSSDNYTNGPGGYSGHADYIFAWPNNEFQTVVDNCYRRHVDCGYQLGDGRQPGPTRYDRQH